MELLQKAFKRLILRTKIPIYLYVIFMVMRLITETAHGQNGDVRIVEDIFLKKD